MPNSYKYFVSYAHEDKKQVEDLLSRLKTQLKIIKNTQFNGWDDQQIVLGSLWKDQITEAMIKSDFGILMLSPAFFASNFIVEEELSHFLLQNNGKTLVLKNIAPVGLKPINLDGSRDLKGMENIQIFVDQKGRWFNQLRGDTTKDAYVEQLASKIHRKRGAS